MSHKRYLACLDVGTTGCRTIIFDVEGKPITQSYYEYKSIFLSPTWIDHDPITWIKATKQTLKQAVKDLNESPDTIAAVSVISQRATFTPVADNGEPLDNAMLWQDKRAIKQSKFIKDKFGDEYIYKKTGLRIDPYFTLPKLLWLRENKPDIFKNSYRFLTVHDLVINYLTGKFITDWTQASRTMLFNIENLEWDHELCERLEIPIDKLPKTVAPGTNVGEITETIAKETGLSKNTPVIAAGGDQQAAALGLGIVEPGLMCINTGTGSFILTHLEKPGWDPEQRVI